MSFYVLLRLDTFRAQVLTFKWFPGGSYGKVSARSVGEPGFDPWVRKIPWRRKQQPTPVLLPGKFHGWRSLLGYSPWGHKESDTTEWLHFLFLTLTVKKKKVWLNSSCSYTSKWNYKRTWACIGIWQCYKMHPSLMSPPPLFFGGGSGGGS